MKQPEINQSPHHPLKPWIIVTAFAILVGFLVLIGMGVKNAQAGPIMIGQKAPDFELTTFEGIQIKSEDLLGKVVLINFWASWCDTCADEAQMMEQVWQEYQPGGQVVFLGLAYSDIETGSLEYLKKYQISYPNCPDLGTKISRMFRIRGIPETFILDRDGKLAYFQYGSFSSEEQIRNLINPLLEP